MNTKQLRRCNNKKNHIQHQLVNTDNGKALLKIFNFFCNLRCIETYMALIIKLYSFKVLTLRKIMILQYVCYPSQRINIFPVISTIHQFSSLIYVSNVRPISNRK